MRNFKELKIELIEAWMDEKNFSELSMGEQALVLEVLDSGQEFDQIREINSQLKNHQSIPTLTPNPDILLNIKMKHFSGKQKVSSSFFNLKGLIEKQFSIPYYQMAAAVFVIIFLFVYSQKPIQKLDPQLVVEQVIVRDTVEVLQKADTVFIDKYIYLKPKVSIASSVNLDESIQVNDFENDGNAEEYLKLINNHRGYTLEEKEYLLTLNIQNE